MRNNQIFLAAMALALVAACDPAGAETVIRSETVVLPQSVPQANMVDFSAFDANGDGVLTMAEVGTKLFYLFDRDGNEVIDNHEFERNSVMTIAPMKKETLTMVDEYGDGDIEHTTYTYESFLKASQLSKFANDLDGLSPDEFIGSSFLALDDNDDKAIDLQEWRESYLAMAKPESAEQERYNN